MIFRESITSFWMRYLGMHASIWDNRTSNSSFSSVPITLDNACIKGLSRLITYLTFPSCSLILSQILCSTVASFNPGFLTVRLLRTTESSTAIRILSLILSGIFAEDFFTSNIQTESSVDGMSTCIRANLFNSLRIPIRIQLPQEISLLFLYR